MDARKHDALDSTNVGPARQVLLAVSRGDDIVLAAKGAIAAAAPPGSRLPVLHLAELRPSLLATELGVQMRAKLARAIKLLKEAGIRVSGLVARPGQAGHVIAGIAEEWHAEVIVRGSSQRRDLATMFLGQRS